MGVLRAPIDYMMNSENNDANKAIANATNLSQENIARATNDANIRMTRETNENQLNIWREQQQHDIDMWNMENRYNSPQAQIERLKAAGLNPYSFLEGAGNATSSAGGQTPPSLTPPHANHMPSFVTPNMVPPNLSAEGIDQLAQAYKNIQEAKKTKSEGEITSVQSDWFKEMALRGENPESLRNAIMLQEYTKMKKENKYITPFMEAQIKKINSETNVNKAVEDVRLKEAKKIMQEIGILKIQKKFDYDSAPDRLRIIGQQLDTMIKQTNADLQVKAAQVKNLNAGSFASEQAGLLTQQQTEGERNENIIKSLRAKLAKMGINPDAKNLPFYASIATLLYRGELQPIEVRSFFEECVNANKLGESGLSKGRADLTKFELFNNVGSPWTNSMRGVTDWLNKLFPSDPENHSRAIYKTSVK